MYASRAEIAACSLPFNEIKKKNEISPLLEHQVLVNLFPSVMVIKIDGSKKWISSLKYI